MVAGKKLSHGVKGLFALGEVPVSEHGVDTLLCVALALWTFGQVVMVYSTIASLPVVVSHYLGVVHQAIVAGCLIVAFACRERDLAPRELVVLALGLFGAMTAWRRGSDAHIIVLLLFAITLGNIDIRRLARWYVASALAGLLVTMAFQAFGISAHVATLQGAKFVSGHGFSEFPSLSYLLFSIVVGIVLGAEELETPLSVAAAVVCVVSAGSLFVALHAVRIAAAFMLLGAYLAFQWLQPRLTHAVMSSKAVRWGVALLPLLLFCLSFDASMLYGITAFEGGYSGLIWSYGYASLIGLYLLYARGVLRLGLTGADQLLLVACVAFALLLMGERMPMYLEFDCALLVLARGLAPLPQRDAEAAPRERHDLGEGHGLARGRDQ